MTNLTLQPTPRNAAVVANGSEQIIAAWNAAQAAAQTAVDKALICGQLMVEKRDSIDGSQSFDRTKPDHSKFAFWMEKFCPQIPRGTAYRWMQMAERVAECCRIESGETPLSLVYTAPEKELTAKALEWRQAVFAFIEGKTMKECLAGVVVEGDEAHRITRAHNGRTAKGAGGGGNRKNFVGFIGVKLRHLTTFLNQKLTPAEQSKISASFAASIQKWPRWQLEELAENLKTELKLSEEQRAGRKD